MHTHALHANWYQGHLHLWAEVARPVDARSARAGLHPFVCTVEELGTLVGGVLPSAAAREAAEVRVLLPTARNLPLPSPTVAHAVGHAVAEDSGEAVVMVPYSVPSLAVPPADALDVLDAMDASFGEAAAISGRTSAVDAGAGLRYYVTVGRFVRWLLAQQRFVPSVVQDFAGNLHGLWQPWLADEATVHRLQRLTAAMPPAARAADDGAGSQAWPILEDLIVRVCDSQCRRVLVAETMHDTIAGRKPAEDPHVAWLTGLLDAPDGISAVGEQKPELVKRVRNWIGQLDQRGISSSWRLSFRLEEPLDLPAAPAASTADGEVQITPPASGLTWPLRLGLQSVEDPRVTIDAEDVWLMPAEGGVVLGHRVDQPQELLLAELARAARLYKQAEKALEQAEPAGLQLTTNQAYEFLREHRSILAEQGFIVHVPAWWDAPGTRLGVRLHIDSGEAPQTAPGSASPPRIGLNTLVNYRWQISLGQTSLSLQDFQKLAAMRSPLVLIDGRWVEVRPEDVQAAVAFIRENPGGEMELGRAIRLAYAADLRQTGLPVVGMDVSGWLASVFGDGTGPQKMPMLGAPDGFVGSLRPYQVKGLSWLSFMDRFGLGSCLADDMGLGKTIQLLAMLLHERQGLLPTSEQPGPTLLVVPMSVLGNWVRESRRFAPSIRVMVHHGPLRAQGEAFLKVASEHDLVVTTYSLAHRDRETLARVPWWRIALDEAQNIKNPVAKQTQAIRSLDTPRRIALTGTPIENRLSELWSIIDFINPGLLGTIHDFRSRFALPIERYRDQIRAKRLRSIVQPFILRRLKTDPNVIADLPEKVESKEYCYLTPEQASLYESTVKQMLSAAEAAEGIHRRGLILAGLVKLKQICNHPEQYLKDRGEDADGTGIVWGAAAPARSGKCVRLIQMLDEVIASGGQALVFTQFRQMGNLLAQMLRRELDREVLLLHGGTTLKDREAMIAAFQKGDGSNPVFILSLKAGGVGLNLTAANHVFHFDRWWNPAVESQATDRAFRLGQTRTVQVHKFVVAGTLEERIDQMIEQKSELADKVIGSGESWLTELSLSQLRDVLMLRPDAVATADEAEEVSA